MNKKQLEKLKTELVKTLDEAKALRKKIKAAEDEGL